MKWKYIYVWIAVTCSLVLSGCWDKKELNEVAVVIGVGIDKTTDEQEYKVTAQVIKPASGDEKAGGSELPTWSLSAKGNTIMGAIRNLNELSPRRLYWAHLQIIIFGDELAREGVAPVITWFERDRDSRAGSFLVVTQGSAEDLLNKKIELGNVPAKAMAEMLDGSSSRQINASEVKLRDFMTLLATPGVDPVLDVINPKEIRGKVETYELKGVAIFKKDKLKGYVTGPESTGTEIINNKHNFSIMEGNCPGDNNGFFTYQITDFTSKVKPRLEGNLTDQSCKVDLLEQRYLTEVEKEITRKIKESIEKEFNIAKEMESDIYGIGRDLRRFYPSYWKKQNDSYTYLDQVEFDIQVESNVRRSGLIIEPTQLKLKEVTK
jgi:spore germination protein KC